MHNVLMAIITSSDIPVTETEIHTEMIGFSKTDT